MKSFSMLASFVIYVTVAAVVPAQGQSSGFTDEKYKLAFENGKMRSNEIQNTFSERMARLVHGIACGDIVIAEGDSWFDYGYRDDIISELEEVGWVVYSSAHYGDTLEDMLYDDGQIESVYSNLVRIKAGSEIAQSSPYPETCLVKVLSSEREYIRFPKAILLSLGGNDILGKTLALMLEHGDSSASKALSDQIKKGLFVRIHRSLIEYISTIQHFCIGTFGSKCESIPIFLHGYDYVKATGKAFFKFGIGPGPWIKPTFDKKNRINDSKWIIESLVKDFNLLLCEVASRLSNGSVANPVFHISFLGMVQDHWKDEIHPNSTAAMDLAEKISSNIVNFHNSKIPGGQYCIK